MNRMTRSMESVATRCLIALLIIQMAVMPALADELTYQQNEAVWQDFGNWEKAYGISTKALQELMGNERTKNILERYANALLVINVGKEIVHTGDLQAALLLIKDKLQDKLIEEIAPNFHFWLEWMMWAKAGMELFKDLVFDPMVENSQIDTYNGLRASGLDPEDAFTGVRGYGYIVERAKKEFRKSYGDLPFQQGTDELLPAWETKFLQFAKACIESRYQEKLHEEVIVRFKAQAADEAAKLAELREQLLLLLRQNQVGRLEVVPSASEIYVGDQAVLSALAIYADPSAPRSAKDVTGECTWRGGTSDNVFTASQADAGRTVTITADYYGVIGTATIKVVGADCGDHGRWNPVSKRCDCDTGYVYNLDLGECVRKDLADAESEVKEILGDMEHRFYGAVKTFDEHFENFVAGLKANAGGSIEEICSDANLAYSFTRAAAAYDLVESYYSEALNLVGRGKRGLNWEALAVGNYEADIHVLDQIRLEMFRKDYQRVSEKGESLPTLLAQYAPGCDPEDMLDRGARTAETDQDAETGIDGGNVASGGGGGGELRFERSGEPMTQINNRANCSGGSMALNVTRPSFPGVIRPGDVLTISVTFNWSVTGSNIEDSDVLAVVFFGDQYKESQHYGAYSGSRTELFTFTASESMFLQPAMTIVVTVGGGILCDGGSSDDVLAQYIQAYIRAGSK